MVEFKEAQYEGEDGQGGHDDIADFVCLKELLKRVSLSLFRVMTRKNAKARRGNEEVLNMKHMTRTRSP
jgi:hypothetical protein